MVSRSRSQRRLLHRRTIISNAPPYYNGIVNSSSSLWDVIIGGAGIIGVSLALELRKSEASVLVLDSRDPGREASSAAAGMLAPADPETPLALRPLATASAEMFPEFVRELEAAAQMQ